MATTSGSDESDTHTFNAESFNTTFYLLSSKLDRIVSLYSSEYVYLFIKKICNFAYYNNIMPKYY